MKEHIQETNLIDSFFIRYRKEHVSFKRSQKYASRAESIRQKTKETGDRVKTKLREYDSEI